MERPRGEQEDRESPPDEETREPVHRPASGYLGCVFGAVLIVWALLVVVAGTGFLVLAFEDCISGCTGGRIRFAVAQSVGASSIAAASIAGAVMAHRAGTLARRIALHAATATVVLFVEGLVLWIVLLGVRF